ncbi:T9SS type A sorting domain-containing protein [Winogradskyella sediminis]|uniref:T9SS type A sorting domain-containing protein n=1 Tax=Winogradskyella sediminis TaxID=1382466 RepID=UPI003AA8F76E
MKHIYVFLIALFIGSIGFGQGFENFDNSNATGSYGIDSFEGNNNITWSYNRSRDANGDNNNSGIDLPALMLRRLNDDSKVTSGTISGGIGDFSVKLYKGFTGTGNRQVELFINGVSQGTSTPFDDFDEHIFSVSGINIQGDFTIEIRNIASRQVIIDDITWTAFSASGPANPTTFSATTSSSSQINLAYDDNTDGDDIIIVFDTDNTFTTPLGTPTSVGTAFAGGTILYDSNGSGTYNHTGLSASTTYYYMAYSYDGTEYSAGLSAGAMTPCATVSSFPFTEGFEGGVLPTCWSQEYETGTTDWTYTDGDSNALSAYTGSFNAQFYNTSGDQTKLISPALDLSGVSNPTLSYWHAQEEWSPDQDELRVYYKTSAGGTWTLIPGQEFTSSIGSWTQESVLLPNPSSDYYIAFDATGDYGRGVVLDDIEINGEIPTTDTLVMFTSSSAFVSEGVGTYDLEFSITNEDALNATTFDVALTTGDASDINTYTTQTVTFPANSSANQTLTIAVTDDAVLETDETLTFTIQNVTGGNNAAVGILDTFDLTITNNDLPPPTSLPYSEDFSDCFAAEWTPYDEAGNDFWDCSGGEYVINGYTGTDDIDWLISDFSIDFDAYTSVNIDVTTQEQYGDTTNTPGEFELLYSTDYTGGDPTTATWTALSFDPNNTSSYGTLSPASVTSVDASSITGTAYLAFKYDMNFGSGAEDWRVQNIEIYENIALDADTEVYESMTQIAGNTYYANAITTSATAKDALAFIIEDQGTTDGEPTQVTTMRFVPGPNNTADWSDHIQGITLYDENFVDYSPTTTITDSELILEFGTPISIADGTALEFFFGFYLNTTNIVDQSIIQFQINETSHGFEADASGSNFADSLLFEDVVGNNFTIDVYVAQLIFSQQPSNTFVNTAMTPDISVAAVDINGNIDTSYNLDIEITSSGTLSGSPLVATPVNGVATFVGVTHTALGTALVLTADDDLYPAITSTPFDIEAMPVGPVVIAIQDFDNTTPEWTYTNEISFFDNTWGGDGYYGIIDIASAFPIDYENMQGNILGENDLDDEDDYGTAGFATTTFATIDISTYNNVELTFDWDVVGYNANNDDARYEVFYDGVGQGTVYLLDGNNTEENGEGTVTISIPDSVNNIALEIEIRNNGGGGYSGFDNFKLEGDVISTSTTYTFNGTWSPSNPNGAATASDAIVITSGDASISSDTAINSVTVNPGAALTVDASTTLTVTDAVTLESTSTSYSSLILDGAISGTIHYERHVNGNAGLGDTNAIGDNDLVTPPLSGQTFGAFAAANSNLLTNPVDATEKAFAIFDKSTGDYENYNTTDNASTLLTAGTGYRAATSNTATLVFTGTANSGDVTIDIDHSGPSYQEWNLIGNPYPSYLDAEAFLNYEVATGIKNMDLLGDTSGIYGYDGNAENGWDIINLANAAGRLITPGQGFLVGADATNAASYGLEFKTSMRAIGNSDDFIAGRDANTLTYLKLNASTATEIYTTQFYFNAEATQGLDAGYDATIWGGTAPNFALFSHLIEDNNGLPMALQALDVTDLSNVTIPLGVNANQGEQLTFSINASTLPSTVNVYLEDNVANTSTLLNTTDYILTPNTALNGTGRFYLRVSNSTLSTIDNTLEHLSIYTHKTDKSIVVAGQLLEPTTATIYDVQGRLVLSTLLQSTERSQAIDVSALNTGIYVIKLHNASQNKTQKVIIR